MTEEQMDEIKAGLSAAEEWLWEDGLVISDYTAKLYELRDAIKPAVTRREEAEARPKALARAHEVLERVAAELADEAFLALMPANETETMAAKRGDFAAWLAEKEAAQEGRALTEEPAFMAGEVRLRQFRAV
jgi:hypothetical protein